MLKKWINKQTVTVFIMTFIITSMFPIYAVTKQSIDVTYRNIKISVNNKIVPSDTEPFIYDGRTFLPVRAVAEALNKDVKYNEITDTVEITDRIISGKEVTTNTMSETTSTPINTETNKLTSTPDGITNIDTWDGKQYVGTLYIHNKIKEKGYGCVFNSTINTWQIIKNEEVMLDNIPTTIVYGAYEVEMNYYINNVLPLIK